MVEEEINFDAEEKKASKQDAEVEMTSEDFEGSNFIKIKPPGEELILEIEKIIKNNNIQGKNNETGATYDIGLKDRNGKVRRIDIHTKDGIFTINSWEVYFKLFKQPNGLLVKYANEHDKKFNGAKISLTRNYNGNYGSMSIGDLAKIKECSEEEAKKYQELVRSAMKDKRLYEVKLL